MALPLVNVQRVCLTAPSGRVLVFPTSVTPFKPTVDATVPAGTIEHGFGTAPPSALAAVTPASTAAARAVPGRKPIATVISTSGACLECRLDGNREV